MNPNISHFYSYEGQIIYKTYTLVLILIEKYFLYDLLGMYMQNNLRKINIYNI